MEDDCEILRSYDGQYWHLRCIRIALEIEGDPSVVRDGGAHGFACPGCMELLGDDE